MFSYAFPKVNLINVEVIWNEWRLRFGNHTVFFWFTVHSTLFIYIYGYLYIHLFASAQVHRRRPLSARTC